MALVYRNGAAECTGCMRCYDDEDELYPNGYKFEDEEDLYND